jgi:hypothetical protein
VCPSADLTRETKRKSKKQPVGRRRDTGIFHVFFQKCKDTGALKGQRGGAVFKKAAALYTEQLPDEMETLQAVRGTLRHNLVFFRRSSSDD